MVGMHWVRRVLDGTGAQLEQAGDHLLALYEALSVASHGRIPFRAVRPLALGSGAAVVGLLAVILTGALLCSVLFGHAAVTPRAGDVIVSDAPQFASVLRCSQCGWNRPMKAGELRQGADRSGAYRCEKCGTQTAYPQRLPRALLTTQPPRGTSR
jgi:hypothetical protein